jgi:hypothetical protein
VGSTAAEVWDKAVRRLSHADRCKRKALQTARMAEEASQVIHGLEKAQGESEDR